MGDRIGGIHLSASADASESSRSHAPVTTDTPTYAFEPFACGLTSGEFDGITNAGGPAPGLGADAP